MDYKLISFHKEKDQEWEVYGHLAPGTYNLLGSFKIRTAAIEYAHTYSLPVVEGKQQYHLMRKLIRI